MNAKPHSPEWLIANADHGVAFERACASALERLLAENANLQQQLEAIGAGGVGPLMPSKLTAQDIADSALLGNIESPFNACMHQEHCKRWKEQAQNHVPDAGNMVPAGWKLVPIEPTREMIEAGKDAHYEAEKRIQEPDAWSPSGFANRAVRAANVFQAMLDAAPQPPVVEQPQIDWKYLYQKEKRRAEMWVAKYEHDIGKLEVAVPVAQQPQSEQQPASVAKVVGMDEFGPMLLWHRAWTDFPVGTKLYTHPQPKREPLTNSQINRLIADGKIPMSGNPYEVFRAAEAAHQIGVKQ